MRLSAEVIGTAPVERVDVLHGTTVAQTVRPYRAADLGRRVRVLWQGAEYRGRGRETLWQGKLTVSGNRIARFAAVNFLNPERIVQETAAGTALSWTSVTTGNLAGIDLWLERADQGTLEIETNIVSGKVDLAALADETRTLRRRRPRAAAQRLSPPRSRLEPQGDDRSQRELCRRRRSSGLSSRDPGRRPSGLVESDLPDRLRKKPDEHLSLPA